jgi:hypothetical protein
MKWPENGSHDLLVGSDELQTQTTTKYEKRYRLAQSADAATILRTAIAKTNTNH